MTRMIGYIRNARSTGGGALPAPAPDLVARAPANFADLDAALDNMRALGVRTLVIDGGDGTVREVLSRAPDIWRDAPLDYAIVANGNTNLIARSAGALPADDPVGAVRRGGLTRRDMRLLRVDRPGGVPPVRGFIMGAGAYEAATRMAQQDLDTRHGLQVAQTILKLLFSRDLRAGARFAIAHDGGPAADEDRMLFGMTSLPGALIFGLSPFWNAGAGPLRWLDIAANPPFPLLAAPFVAYGRPMGWMRRAYRSGSSHQVEMTLTTDLIIDGEPFSPGAEGRVVISAKETAAFLSTT